MIDVSPGSGAPTTKKHDLVNPRPHHERIVLLHFAGYKAPAISEAVGLSEGQIGEVIRSEWAQGFLEQLRGRLRENILDTLAGRMLEMADRAVTNLKTTVDADISPLHPAKSHQDRVSIKLLEDLGLLGRTSGGAEEGGNKIHEGAADRLASALEKANRIRERLLIQEEAEEIKDAVVVGEEAT